MVFWLIAGTLATVGFLWFTPIPLGVPGEWTWRRVEATADLPYSLAFLACAAVIYYVFVGAGLRAIHRGGSRTAGLWLAMLVPSAFGWLWMVQEAGPPTTNLEKIPFVLFYKATSGYFDKVRYEEPDAGSFLKKYEALMAEGDVLHIGTHPPGLFLVFQTIGHWCDAFPGVVRALANWQPLSVREGFEIIRTNSAFSTHPLRPADEPILWLAGILAMVVSAAGVVPLYLLAREWQQLEPGQSSEAGGNSPDARVAAWLAAAIWPCVPAIAIFLPKSDSIFPTLGLAISWLTLRACARGSVVLALLAGVLMWLGLLCSLAFIPVGGIAVLVGLAGNTRRTEPLRWLHGALRQTVWPVLLCGLLGVIVPAAIFSWYTECNLFNVWRWNYVNHAGFYQQFTRTYWKWLLTNPLELVLAVGWPVALGSLYAARVSTAHWRAVALPTLGIWVVLWLTGKNSGEAARLWLVLMPWLLVLLAVATVHPAPAPVSSPDTVRSPRGATRAPVPASRFLLASSGLTLLVAQMIVSALTVVRVGGFHFGAGG